MESLYDKNARELFKVSIDYNSANNKLRYIEEASNEDEVWDAMQKLGYNTYNISFDTFIELINNLNDNVLDKKIISYEEFCADIEGESTIVIEVLSDDKKHIEIAKKITDLLKSVNADYTTDY
ncbi:MAG: hypothetical protein RSC92_01805 [Clostridia bacterium]